MRSSSENAYEDSFRSVVSEVVDACWFGECDAVARYISAWGTMMRDLEAEA